MSKLDIDNKGNVVIFNAGKDSDVSFLLEEFFDNSRDKLKEDIEICQDTPKKNLLIQFAEKYDNGELDFISDYWQNDETLQHNSTSQSFEFGFNRDGTGEFTAHDITAVHSGFWYAADNIDKEIKNIVRCKHNYEGFVIASERIDTVISILKVAPNFESAIRGIQDLGLTRAQAEAVMSSRLDKLTSYDTKYLQNRIACCEKLGIVLKGIHTFSENESGIAFYAAQLRKSPMFQLSLSSKELFHSNFLYWISQFSREMFKKVIKELFISAGNTPVFEWPENFDVKREYNNFDLCVIDGTNNKILLVIENKVKSIPSYSQLNEYNNKSNGADHLLLSLSTEFPRRDEMRNELKWTIANYEMLSAILKKVIKDDEYVLDSYQTGIIRDYAGFIKNLHDIQDRWEVGLNNSFNDRFYDAELETLRINDLKQKHRFSIICSSLYEKLNKELDSEIVWGSSRDDIFNGSHKPQHRKVFIGWGMTRAQGLLEIKMLVEENVILLVQIQGDQYRHCVELNNGSSAEENWSVYSQDPLTAWFINNSEYNKVFCPFKNSPIPLDIRPDTTRRNKCYNKYGNCFLYKSIGIPCDTTIKEVFDMIVFDCRNILDKLIQKS